VEVSNREFMVHFLTRIRLVKRRGEEAVVIMWLGAGHIDDQLLMFSK